MMNVLQLIIGMLTGLLVGVASALYLPSRLHSRGSATHRNDDLLVVLLTVAAFALGLFISYAFA